MTIDKIADHYNCSKSYILSWVDKGLPFTNRSGIIYVNISDVIKFISDGKA